MNIETDFAISRLRRPSIERRTSNERQEPVGGVRVNTLFEGRLYAINEVVFCNEGHAAQAVTASLS